ncbi:MAG: tetratricopeptide repeat protein [Gemmatimonadetes bacterium]|nr:tetratricopeptide repeat protein [Gemmatimonadota bacterium]
MNAAELYQEGRLDEAIEALGVALRENPADNRRRTFLFELLCFAGNYERAEKQLDMLGRDGKDAEMGALLYRGAIHAERLRQQMFEPGGMPPTTGPAPLVSGTLNGVSFSALEDADPRIGARLELYVAGQYTWLPLAHVQSVQMEPPKRLRDLLWAPVVVRVTAEAAHSELGEVLMPVLTPGAWKHGDPLVRLGRVTEVADLADGITVPVGQKLFLVDGEEVPLLEMRELVINPVAETA